jgi:hypothetical protein
LDKKTPPILAHIVILEWGGEEGEEVEEEEGGGE